MKKKKFLFLLSFAFFKGFDAMISSCTRIEKDQQNRKVTELFIDKSVLSKVTQKFVFLRFKPAWEIYYVSFVD